VKKSRKKLGVKGPQQEVTEQTAGLQILVLMLCALSLIKEKTRTRQEEEEGEEEKKKRVFSWKT